MYVHVTHFALQQKLYSIVQFFTTFVKQLYSEKKGEVQTNV